MSTEDGRFDDGPSGPVRVADFDALDEPDETAPVVRVASFDLDEIEDDEDGGDGGDAGGGDATVGRSRADEGGESGGRNAVPTSGLRTVDLEDGDDPDAEEPPRPRVVSLDTELDDTDLGSTPRRARFDGPPASGRRGPRDGTGRGSTTGDRAGADRSSRGRDERSARGRRGGNGRGADPGPPADDEARAKEICLRLLTDRARTVKELRDALLRKEIPEDVADRVLERFDEVGLVDDEAFAGQWVRSRHNHRGLGRRAIAMELHRKGVAREIADEALTEIDAESEEAKARELVARKIRTVKVGTREERASASRRLVGMLARKGYGAGVAYAVVKEAIAARGAEEDELGEEPPED